jgi:ABC-type multidrug transport system fused ATPase/permease subunit
MFPQHGEKLTTISIQDVTLFSGTIEENIRYAAPDAPQEKVIEAAKQVLHSIHASLFISLFLFPFLLLSLSLSLSHSLNFVFL